MLPDIDTARRLSQSLALLDAILMQDWALRYYSFNCRWDADEMLASMRNGSGDSYFLIFAREGAFLKGFVHDSVTGCYCVEERKVWPGIIDSVPDSFRRFIGEPAFLMAETSFLLWRSLNDSAWHSGDIAYPTGDDHGGAKRLLYIFDGNPKTYAAWAEEYYERPIQLEPVDRIYRHEPITLELAKRLNPNVDREQLSVDISEIGYVSGMV